MPPSPRRPAAPQIKWERLPLAWESAPAREWLLREAASGLAPTTVDAYSRAVERFLAYCRRRRIAPRRATTDHLLAYLRELEAAGLGRAARAQRLTAVRLFYAFVVEQGLRSDNPLAGGVRLPAPGDVAVADGRAADEEGAALPWVPDEDEWLRILAAAAEAGGRTRLMLALAYDGALSREELCALRVADVDPHRALLRIAGDAPPAPRRPSGAPGPLPGEAPRETARLVPLSPLVAERCAAYLREERHGGGALFVSASPRNRAEPLAGWAWSKVVRAIAQRSGADGFTTRTPRHLRLTDLARAGDGAAAIARFAGHRRPGQAQRYLQLAHERPDPDGAAVVRRRTEQLAAVLFRHRR